MVFWHVPIKRKTSPRSPQAIQHVFRTWIEWLIESSEHEERRRAGLGPVRRFLADVFESHDMFITFNPKHSKAWAQVAIEGDSLLVNIDFPSRDDFTSAFTSRAIAVPVGWKETLVSPGKAITFQVSIPESGTIAPFLEKIFIKFYGCPKDGIVQAACS